MDEAIAGGFENVRHTSCEQVDGDHGRVETRRCYVTDDIAWLRERHPHFPKLAGIVCVESVRHVMGKAEPPPTRRYYITSRRADAATLLPAARGHWGIENPLHASWSLHDGEQCLSIAGTEQAFGLHACLGHADVAAKEVQGQAADSAEVLGGAAGEGSVLVFAEGHAIAPSKSDQVDKLVHARYRK